MLEGLNSALIIYALQSVGPDGHELLRRIGVVLPGPREDVAVETAQPEKLDQLVERLVAERLKSLGVLPAQLVTPPSGEAA